MSRRSGKSVALKRTIPDAVRETVRARLADHAAKRWAERCRAVEVRFRGDYAYVDAFVPGSSVDGGARIQLCRLGYLGDAERWAFAFFKYSDEVYEPSVTFSGSFEATPEEAFDTAASVYL